MTLYVLFLFLYPYSNNGGSGLIAFHGQSGDIMFQGATEETTQTIFSALNDYGFDMYHQGMH
jgi:sulfite reductase alpha subunit